MELKFVTGKPALVAGKTLVIADLHIGIEHDFHRSGIKLPSGTESMRESIEEMIEGTGAETLVIIGDLKHKVPGTTYQEVREVPEFLKALSKRVHIDVVLGNHDPGLEGMSLGNVTIRPNRGFMRERVYFSHGHTWPLPEFLKAEYVIVGHDHPQIEFRDSLGYRFSESVWVRASLDRKKLAARYKKIPRKLPELIVLPKFNRLSGGISVNRSLSETDRSHKKSGIGTLVRSAKLRDSKIYLLDGTFLGALKSLLQQ